MRENDKVVQLQKSQANVTSIFFLLCRGQGSNNDSLEYYNTFRVLLIVVVGASKHRGVLATTPHLDVMYVQMSLNLPCCRWKHHNIYYAISKESLG
jgi:hypothetical protein